MSVALRPGRRVADRGDVDVAVRAQGDIATGRSGSAQEGQVAGAAGKLEVAA